ncbi:MAG: hypothetical protein ACOC1F_00165, partial [Myxococcota bacterium]
CALLVLDGELEERMTVYLPGQGITEQPLFLAGPGHLVSIQALVSTYRHQPSFCSLSAVADGWAAKVTPDRLPATGGLFDTMFQKTMEALERERQMVSLYGGVASLFQNAPDAMPFVPADPQQMMQRLLRALEERGYLSRSGHGSAYSTSWTDRVRVLEETNQGLREKLERNTKALSSALAQCRTLENRCDFENRARAALEQRLSDLMQQMVDKPEDTALSSRFPAAVTVLESAELEELERAARQHRKLADQFENRANMLHRAIELLEHDNPGMLIAEDVMMLMLGEEPPDRETPVKRNTMPMLLDPAKPPQKAPRPSSSPDSSPVSCPVPDSRSNAGLELLDDDDVDFVDEE